MSIDFFFFFFFNDTATTEIYTLSLHDALPILRAGEAEKSQCGQRFHHRSGALAGRSEEHTSELQSLAYLVCRLLLEKKKTKLTRSTLSRPTPLSTDAVNFRLSVVLLAALTLPS